MRHYDAPSPALPTSQAGAHLTSAACQARLQCADLVCSRAPVIARLRQPLSQQLISVSQHGHLGGRAVLRGLRCALVAELRCC